MAFSPSSRARLTSHDLDRFPATCSSTASAAPSPPPAVCREGTLRGMGGGATRATALPRRTRRRSRRRARPAGAGDAPARQLVAGRAGGGRCVPPSSAKVHACTRWSVAAAGLPRSVRRACSRTSNCRTPTWSSSCHACGDLTIAARRRRLRPAQQCTGPACCDDPATCDAGRRLNGGDQPWRSTSFATLPPRGQGPSGSGRRRFRRQITPRTRLLLAAPTTPAPPDPFFVRAGADALDGDADFGCASRSSRSRVS